MDESSLADVLGFVELGAWILVVPALVAAAVFRRRRLRQVVSAVAALAAVTLLQPFGVTSENRTVASPLPTDPGARPPGEALDPRGAHALRVGPIPVALIRLTFRLGYGIASPSGLVFWVLCAVAWAAARRRRPLSARPAGP